MFPKMVGICQSQNHFMAEFAIAFVRVTMAMPRRHGHGSRRSRIARASSGEAAEDCSRG